MNINTLISICGLLLTLISIAASSKATQNKITQDLNTSQAVTNNEIKHLTEEVKKHNNFAQRIPVLEGRLELLNQKIESASHRLDDLERNEP